MAAKKQQTHAKRARELAVKERRERKRAKKEETAEERAAARTASAAERDAGVPSAEEDAEAAAREWIR
jgi:hypothetical protein